MRTAFSHEALKFTTWLEEHIDVLGERLGLKLSVEHVGYPKHWTPQASAPEIPWRKMRGMRNLAAHEYFGIDVGTVWQTATSDVPPLKPLLEALLAR